MQMTLKKIWPFLLLTLEIVGAVDEDCCCRLNATKHSSSFHKYFDKIIPDGYNLYQPPTEDGVQLINVSFAYFSVPQVVFGQTMFEAEFLMIVSWRDRRLITEWLTEDNSTDKFIEIPEDTARRMWIPTIFFANCKQCSAFTKHTVGFNLNQSAFNMFDRISLEFACAFDLSYYPFDSHECSVDLQLMERFNRAKLKLQDDFDFNFKPDAMIKEGMPPEFQFRSLRTTQACSPRFPVHVKHVEHCLQYYVKIRRIASYHMMLVYCPTVVIVLISWISFWLSVESSAPRVTLGLTSLLTLTTQFANEQKTLPPVAYVKALDVWMLMCVFMVFGSLLEFALAHNLKLGKKHVQIVETVREDPKTVKPRPLPEVNNPGSANALSEAKWTTQAITRPKTQKKEINWFDAKARFVFPLIFILFNIIYWPCYTCQR